MHVAVTMALVWAAWGSVEAAVRPVVIFTPDWNKFFAGDSITMTCHSKSTVPIDETYVWYKEGEWLHTGKSYTIQQAQDSDEGRYQCQTSASERSDSVILNIQNSYVIVQAPLHIFEGDDVRLRCHHYPGYAAKQTVFYKNHEVFQRWGSESELFIENVFTNFIWRYRCTKQVYHHLIYYHHSDEATFSVQELFTTPVLRLTEGDDTILTCETSLSLLRETTKLQFAFFRDGRNIQDYSLTNSFNVQPAWLTFPGSYTCQVKTTSNTVKKTSMPLVIEGNDKVEGIKNDLLLYPTPEYEENI